jgi:NAD(P)-dependent dehydrogenase (short-subunit alcohol dehydrogenase family)
VELGGTRRGCREGEIEEMAAVGIALGLTDEAGRARRPEEVVAVVAFLLTDEASRLNIDVLVDGGVNASVLGPGA